MTIKNEEDITCTFCGNGFPSGDANEELVNSSVDINNVPLFYYSLYLDKRALQLTIDNYNGDIIARKRRAINFCPICGRRLEDE